MSIHFYKILIVLIANFFCKGLMAQSAMEDTLMKQKVSIFFISKGKIHAFRPNTLKQDFYSSNLAFFCKQELKIEKAIKFPFRFRIGSIEQSDYLEGKKQSVIR